MEILLAAAIVLIVSGALGAMFRPALEPDETLQARFGDVPWNHELHARMPEIVSCQVCHHTERPGAMRPKPCIHCHKRPSNLDALVLADLFMEVEPKTYADENGPPAAQALHAKCIGCHKAMTAGPVICRDCHTQRFSGTVGLGQWDHRVHARKIDMNDQPGLEDNCVVCHHQDQKAKADGDYRPCKACHKPAAIQGLKIATGIKDHEKVKHGRCYTCHSEFNPEDDLRTCQDCHKGIAVDPERARPTLEHAIHKRCGECHRPHNAGLEPGMPVYCVDCHKPDPSWIQDPSVGTLLWNHELHAQYGEMTCDECHHTDSPGDPHMACRSCHGTGRFDTPPLAKVLEERCLGCHTEKHVGPPTWDHMRTEKLDLGWLKFVSSDGSFYWDHRFHAISAAISCRDCHHTLIQKEGQYVTAARAKRPWAPEASHMQPCENCHGPNGPVSGGPADGTEAPKLEDAYKKICLECHQRIEGGPLTWNAFFETEPLEKP